MARSLRLGLNLAVQRLPALALVRIPLVLTATPLLDLMQLIQRRLASTMAKSMGLYLNLVVQHLPLIPALARIPLVLTMRPLVLMLLIQHLPALARMPLVPTMAKSLRLDLSPLI